MALNKFLLACKYIPICISICSNNLCAILLCNITLQKLHNASFIRESTITIYKIIPQTAAIRITVHITTMNIGCIREKNTYRKKAPRIIFA